MPALLNGCVDKKKVHIWLKNELIRKKIRADLMKAYKVLVYGKSQISLYEEYGIKKLKIKKIGFQFDPSDMNDINVTDDNYFALTGQSIVQKGWHLLSEILNRIKTNPKIKISITNQSQADIIIDKFNLRKYINNGIIEIVTCLNNRKEYLDFMSRARAIIIPTYYYTTGEFVLQESMFLSKPVIVFSVGVHSDFLIHRYNAMMSEIGDLEGFANSIDEINLDINLRRLISNNIKNTSMSLYSKDAINQLNSIFI